MGCMIAKYQAAEKKAAGPQEASSASGTGSGMAEDTGTGTSFANSWTMGGGGGECSTSDGGKAQTASSSSSSSSSSPRLTLTAYPHALVGAPVVEPATGLTFPGTLGPDLPLLGVGVRTSWWGLSHDYAAGLYADCGAFLESDSAVRQATALEELPSAAQARVWKALVGSEKTRAIVIKMVRPTSLKDLAEALSVEALAPRLEASGRSSAGLEAFTKAVTHSFISEKCQAGDELVLTCTGAKTLLVTGTGKTAAASPGASSSSSSSSSSSQETSMEDANVCFALFDAFVGLRSPEVSPTLKESMKKRLGLS